MPDTNSYVLPCESVHAIYQPTSYMLIFYLHYLLPSPLPFREKEKGVVYIKPL